MAFALLMLAAPVSAANIAVSSTCSLANAITSANDNTATGGCIAGDDGEPGDEDIITITATPSVATVITLDAALPQISSDILIEGSGSNAGISGNGRYRVLYVASGGDLKLRDLTISYGSAHNGGGLYVASGGVATLTNANFTRNETTRPASAVPTNGGAIYNAGILSITGGIFSRNTATANRAPSSAGGGAIFTSGDLGVSSATFSRNSAQWGGAINNSGTDGRLRVNGNRFNNNTATQGGGAIGSQQTDGELINRISNNTFTSNSAGLDGGAIAGGGTSSFLVIRGNRFTSNRARRGGAIHSFGGNFDVSLNNFDNNAATQRGGAIDYTIVDEDDSDETGVLLDHPNTNTFSGNSPQNCINVSGCGTGSGAGHIQIEVSARNALQYYYPLYSKDDVPSSSNQRIRFDLYSLYSHNDTSDDVRANFVHGVRLIGNLHQGVKVCFRSTRSTPLNGYLLYEYRREAYSTGLRPGILQDYSFEYQALFYWQESGNRLCTAVERSSPNQVFVNNNKIFHRDGGKIYLLSPSSEAETLWLDTAKSNLGSDIWRTFITKSSKLVVEGAVSYGVGHLVTGALTALGSASAAKIVEAGLNFWDVLHLMFSFVPDLPGQVLFFEDKECVVKTKQKTRFNKDSLFANENDLVLIPWNTVLYPIKKTTKGDYFVRFYGIPGWINYKNLHSEGSGCGGFPVPNLKNCTVHPVTDALSNNILDWPLNHLGNKGYAYRATVSRYYPLTAYARTEHYYLVEYDVKGVSSYKGKSLDWDRGAIAASKVLEGNRDCFKLLRPQKPAGVSPARSSSASAESLPGEQLNADPTDGIQVKAEHGMRSGVQFQPRKPSDINIIQAENIDVVIQAGALEVIDVWGFANQPTEICFENWRIPEGGGIVFIDKSEFHPTVDLAPEISGDGYETCVHPGRAGLVVLVAQLPPGSGQQPISSSPSAPQSTPIQSPTCMARLTHIVNFRAGPGTEHEVVEMLPYDIRLTGLEKTDSWIKVDYHGQQGWIHRSYVIEEGDCN